MWVSLMGFELGERTDDRGSLSQAKTWDHGGVCVCVCVCVYRSGVARRVFRS